MQPASISRCNSFFLTYEPAKGVPNMPTASSAQIRKNINRTTPQTIILFLILFTFLNTSSHKRPDPNSRIPIITKSKSFQFTSDVNCIAKNGMVSRIVAAVKIIVNRLFSIVFVLMNDNCFNKASFKRILINENAKHFEMQSKKE